MFVINQQAAIATFQNVPGGIVLLLIVMSKLNKAKSPDFRIDIGIFIGMVESPML